MVDHGLNLLPSQAKFQAKKIHWQGVTRKYLKVLIGAWLSAVVVIMAVAIGLNWQLGVKKKELKKLDSEVKSLNDRALTSWRVKYMAGMVAKAIGSRFEYGKAFDAVNGAFSSEMGIDKLEMRDNNIFLIAGKTNDWKVISALEKRVKEINQGKREGLSRAKVLSLNVTAGVWSYNLEAGIK